MSATIFKYFGDSDHNLIKNVDQRTKEINKSINNLTEADKTTTNYAKTSKIVMKDLADTNEEYSVAIVQLSQIMPEVAWMSASLNQELSTSEKNLRNAILVARTGQVATNELAEAFNATFLDEVQPHNTRITGAEKLGNDAYLFKYTTLNKSEDTKVYILHAFPVWQNLTGTKYLSVYDGPDFLIHNTTSNCSQAIHNPISNTVMYN